MKATVPRSGALKFQQMLRVKLILKATLLLPMLILNPTSEERH